MDRQGEDREPKRAIRERMIVINVDLSLERRTV
jgi:hypothetical protein